MTVTDPKLLPPPPGWERPSFARAQKEFLTGEIDLYVCDRCGALVNDIETHVGWHKDDAVAYKLVALTIATVMRDIGKVPLNADAREALRWATGT